MNIDIYGLKISCRAHSADLESAVMRPFARFIRPDEPAAFSIAVNEKPIPYDTFPVIPASFSSPRNIIYYDRRSDRKIIDYFGKGVILEGRRQSMIDITSPSRNFLQEAVYLRVMSLLGQFCDTHGMMRIHALGLSCRNTPFLLPLSAGGGKSTMAVEMLKDRSIRLISDDEPIFARSGKVLPLALRIGTLDKALIRSVPSQYIYTIDRMEFGPKHFIDCDYWKSQLERRSLPNPVIILPKRVLNAKPSIKPVSKRAALKVLMRDAVVGIGLYQGVEFLFRESNLEIIKKIHTFCRRYHLALKLLRSSKTYEAVLSNQIQKNTDIILKFIKESASA